MYRHHTISSAVSTLLISAMFLLASQVAGATITGRVIDRTTGAPIQGVNVVVAGNGQVTTDADGTFTPNVPDSGAWTLQLSHVGYRSQEYLSAGSNTETSLLIEMEPVAVPVGSITVTSGRTTRDEFTLPASVAVTTAEEFDEAEFSTTAEVLRGETGVLVQKTTYGHGSPIVRGLIGKYVLLLYDGIRLNKPTFRFGANQYMNTVDMETLERIELIRGPSSVMFGSDAIGGVVNLIPQSIAPDTTQARLSLDMTGRYSSADNGAGSHLRVAGQQGRVSGSYDLSYKKVGDLEAGGEVGVQEPTGWDEVNHAARLAYRLDPARQVRLDFVSVGQNEVPRYDKYVSGSFEQYVFDPQNRLLTALTFDNARPGLFWYASKVGLSFQREEEGRTLRRTGADNYTKARDRITTWGGYLQFQSQLGCSHWLTYGFEHYRHLIRAENTRYSAGGVAPTRPAYPDRSKYGSLGIFLQDEWFVHSALRITGGLRFSLVNVDSPLETPFERYDERFSDLTGSLGVSYFVSPRTNLVARWSRGFRAPNLNDAVVLKYSSSGVDAPSPELDSETSNNFELGAKIRGDRFSGDLFLFYNQLDDLIERDHGLYQGLSFYDEDGDGVRDSAEFDIYQKFNSGRGRIYGVEGESNLVVGREFKLSANLAWTFGENQSAHEPMSRIPPLMGRLGIKWSPRPDWSVMADTRFAGAQDRLSARDEDDSRIEPGGTPGWATINLGSQFEFSRMTITLSLKNILDEAYKEHGSGIYSPGRNLVLVLKYSGS